MSETRSGRSLGCRVLALLAGVIAALAAGGCSGATPSEPVRIDTVPVFSDSVADQTWTLAEAVTFRLPFATGGEGALTYSLGPRLPPGLTFHRSSLKLAGTPTVVGDYPMRYEVADSDDNRADVAVLEFRITVQEPVPADSAPRFTERLDDLTFTVGDAVHLTLPAAIGGNPPLRYSLEPAVPGLAFDPATRELSGMPETAASYPVTYRVEDGDANTATTDADERHFAITVARAAEGDFVAVYDAAAGGDQVFPVDAAALPAGRFSFALDLRGAATDLEVYLISTNPSADPLATPAIATGTPITPSTEAPGLPEREHLAAAEGDFPVPHHYFEIIEFNNNPPVPLGGGSARQATAALHQAPPRVGARFDFWAIDFERSAVVRTPAVARAVVSDRALPLTFVVWVADASWGVRCEQVNCVTQRMVDELAATFLRAGSGNDVHDWVTAVFGEPWGAHDYPGGLLDPATDQIHVLLHDINSDNSTTGGILGYFSIKDVYHPRPGLRRIFDFSNLRLMFYLDSVLLATPDEGRRWAANQRWPGRVILSAAHELQHLIHFYQKEVRHDFTPASEAWLNELASEVADDMVSAKLGVTGPRGVAGTSGGAGEPGNGLGRLPRYNLWNDIQVSTWDQRLANYSIVYALGAYLARTYGVEPLGDMVKSAHSGVAAVEAALPGGLSFGQVLRDWAVANLLSDDPGAPLPYRYNSGGWTTVAAGGLQFELGSINLYQYESVGRFEGPFLHSVAQLNRRTEQEPHSNVYVDLGRQRGLLEGEMRFAAGARFTFVVKQ